MPALAGSQRRFIKGQAVGFSLKSDRRLNVDRHGWASVALARHARE